MERKPKPERSPDGPEILRISDPALPVVSGAVVPPDAEGEDARLGMDRNRALLMLGARQNGTGMPF